mmetsp:Transcript_33662/g.77670  ORF Transcript_33662/g.77670 Transcript_33662/m.77670 type:complete len:108 (+) Transcript_33662:76-399(+)
MHEFGGFQVFCDQKLPSGNLATPTWVFACLYTGGTSFESPLFSLSPCRTLSFGDGKAAFSSEDASSGVVAGVDAVSSSEDADRVGRSSSEPPVDSVSFPFVCTIKSQ